MNLSLQSSIDIYFIVCIISFFIRNEFLSLASFIKGRFSVLFFFLSDEIQKRLMSIIGWVGFQFYLFLCSMHVLTLIHHTKSNLCTTKFPRTFHPFHFCSVHKSLSPTVFPQTTSFVSSLKLREREKK